MANVKYLGDLRHILIVPIQTRHTATHLGARFARSRAEPHRTRSGAAARNTVTHTARTAQGMYQTRFIVALAHNDLDFVAGCAQRIHRLLMRCAQQRCAVYLQNAHAHLQTAVPAGRTARIDLRHEDALIIGVARVALLAVEAALDVHAEALAFCFDKDHVLLGWNGRLEDLKVD